VAVFLAPGGGWDVAEDHAEVAQAGGGDRTPPALNSKPRDAAAVKVSPVTTAVVALPPAIIYRDRAP
jgi:hypothetical protein